MFIKRCDFRQFSLWVSYLHVLMTYVHCLTTARLCGSVWLAASTSKQKHSHLRLILISAAAAERDVQSGQRELLGQNVPWKQTKSQNWHQDWTEMARWAIPPCAAAKSIRIVVYWCIHTKCFSVNQQDCINHVHALMYCMWICFFFFCFLLFFLLTFPAINLIYYFFLLILLLIHLHLFSFFAEVLHRSSLLCRSIHLTKHNCHPELIAYVSKIICQTAASWIT